MKIINTTTISDNVKDMCIEANYYLSTDMNSALKNAINIEELTSKMESISF